MIAPHLISESIPALQLEDTGEKALLLMHEFSINQLAVLDNNVYVGLVTMEDVMANKQLDKSLKSYSNPFRQPFVKNTAHIFDVMRTALEHNVKVVPVINEEHHYLGLISAESCLRSFAVLNSVKEAGGVIELEIPISNYSLSEVSRIVEENEAEIVCFYTHVKHQEGRTEITLKLNTTELGGIVAAFERFEYEIKAVYNETEYTEDLKDRYDALMRYLNV